MYHHRRDETPDGASSDPIPTVRADLVVVGSGAAGLSAALAAADAGARVLILTGGELLSGSSPGAQGGIAAALGPDDSVARHLADTLQVGAGLNDHAAVRTLVRDGQRRVRELLALGVPFDGGAEHPDLGLEAGHTRRRIVHGGGGATGLLLTSALISRVAEHPGISVHEHTVADALVGSDSRVSGVRSGRTLYGGRAVVLATGGYAALWTRTTNRPESRGTGAALAWWAGASLADLEFVQFHPTALDLPGRPAFLLSEALRGDGAQVVDGTGRPIVDPLLPRDVVARAIARYLDQNGPVYLSLRHLDAEQVRSHFPAIAAPLREWGLDLARDLLPIAPAAHYCMGGVRADGEGRTDVPGLYVAGEAACTGVQGANRLASNSLLECLVFGHRAARAALADAPGRRGTWATHPLPSPEPVATTGLSAREAAEATEELAARDALGLGQLLDRFLSVEREGARLSALVDALPDPAAGETPAPYVVAALAARAALLRTESRGAHYRANAPGTLDAWRGRIHWRRGQEPRFERIVA
jgi:L-aspartate oxidase